jgi:molybdate transport system substrate-binding protein
MATQVGVALLACGLVSPVPSAWAGEVTLLAARVLRPILAEATVNFEQTTGHRLSIVYDTAGGVTKRIVSGELADVAITQRPDIQGLVQAGRIESGSIRVIARSGVAVGVPKGAAKPEIGSVSAFKSALLAARSVAYPDPGIGNASGVLFRRVIEQLGITAEVAAKEKVWKMPFVEWAAHNSADLVVTQPTDILGAPSFDLVAWLPDELQDYDGFTWTAGISAKAANPEAGRTLIEVLTSAPAAEIINRKGMKSAATEPRACAPPKC